MYHGPFDWEYIYHEYLIRHVSFVPQRVFTTIYQLMNMIELIGIFYYQSFNYSKLRTCRGGLDMATSVIHIEDAEARKSHVLSTCIGSRHSVYSSLRPPSQPW